ncbi:MAG: DNA methylase [Desulfobacterales bacterium]|nr:DNA methylase [Desulfobacterales bacterium]
MRHRFHALCPYFAMFPEGFVEKWVDQLTRPGDYILDPFSGRGTTPFQALIMGRKAIANDINPVAFCVTYAKTNAPSISTIRRRLTILENDFQPNDYEPARRFLPPFFRRAFSPPTLRQILYLRSQLRWKESNVDCFIAALILGSLHGESSVSPSYLSNQMPRTISTKPEYSMRYWQKKNMRAPRRETFEILRRLLNFRYASEPPVGRATVFLADIRDLPRFKQKLPGRIACVITSPPYFNVTSYEEDQWLRLWFLGGPPFPTYREVSKDDRHENPTAYWNMITDMWRVFGLILAPNANIVVRFGGKGYEPNQLIDAMTACSVVSRRRVRLAHHAVSVIKNKQTDVFRPGSKGCKFEVDCHFRMG